MKRKELHIIADYCLKGDNFDPHHHLDHLKILEARSWKKGEKYKGKERNVQKQIVEVERVRPFGIWGIDSKGLGNSKSVEEHILYILEKIEPHKKFLKKFIDDNPDLGPRFYIYYEMDKTEQDVGAYEIKSDLLKRITDICDYIEFKFTTYDN